MISSVNPAWIFEVNQIFAREGVPWHVWLAIAWEESKLIPWAHNTGTPQVPEDSVGLFQLNRRGGQGAGYGVAQLRDPVFNSQIAVRYIAPAWKQCNGDISCTAVNSGHPGKVPTSDSRVRNIARTHAVIRSLDLTSAVARLLQGVSLPDPGDYLPNPDDYLPDPKEIGSGIVAGIIGGIGGLFDGTKDEVIDRVAPIGGIVLAVALIGLGIQGMMWQREYDAARSYVSNPSVRANVRGMMR